MSDDYISFEEAARYLDVDLDTVTFARLVNDSTLPFFRIEGGNRQVSRAALEAAVERCRIEPGTVGNGGRLPHWRRWRMLLRR